MKKAKPVKVPDQDAAYLRLHHETASVPQMAKKLKRSNVTVYNFMAALGLQPKRSTGNLGHPFRSSNQKLEKFLVHCRIENQNRKTS